MSKCPKCNDTLKIRYYHDAGDHFSMNPSPYSGWRERTCACVKEKEKEEAKERERATKALIDYANSLDW